MVTAKVKGQEIESTAMHPNARWALGLASIPLLPIAHVLFFASAFRLTLGYWPRYNNPDPTNLPWFHGATGVVPLLLLALLAGLMSVAGLLFDWKDGRPGFVYLTGLATFAMLYVWLALDPGGFIEWAAD
jgi:hypothetical protein